ncbi:cyclase family protein [Gilvirhabdus luticola]|nr:cyclase family protein [Yeosuana sp. MJ-SS3]
MLFFLSMVGCKPKPSYQNFITPKEIIDLGALVTEDLPEQVWGRLLNQYGFEESNSFNVINQEFEFPDGVLSVTNSYLTIFNHGGPHVDVPSHLNLGWGIDSYEIDDFIGPLTVIDVSHLPFGRTVSLSEIMKHDIQPGDIVIIYTKYSLPDVDEMPQRIALSQKAAKYLANLPIKAFGTDSFNVESDDNPTNVERDDKLTELISETAVQRIVPIHYEFLSKGIPIFEQLFNVDKLLTKKKMYFVGPPLNIKDGDGMIVRPVVFVYE